jgi:hypothetical protein
MSAIYEKRPLAVSEERKSFVDWARQHKNSAVEVARTAAYKGWALGREVTEREWLDAVRESDVALG